MKVHKREQPLPPIQEQSVEEGNSDVKEIEVKVIPQTTTRKFIDPCELLFKPLLGEFLGTLFLDFFAAQLLFFASENLILSALCTGLLRYTLMYVFSNCCCGEFNPALSIGKLFCLERSLLISITLMAGQFFGAFIGEILFAAVRPATVQVFPFVFFNESDAYIDRLPPSFQAYFLIELINTSLFVVTYLRTEHFGCMAAIIAMTMAYNVGLETRATGNFAQIFAHCVVGTLWHSPTDPWRYVEAALAASFIAPFIAAVLYWLLRSANDMRNADEESIT